MSGFDTANFIGHPGSFAAWFFASAAEYSDSLAASADPTTNKKKIKQIPEGRHDRKCCNRPECGGDGEKL